MICRLREYGRSLIVLAMFLSGNTPFRLPAQTAQGDSRCTEANTTADMQNCETARDKRAELHLAGVVTELGKRLDQTARSKLRAAQMAWSRFRDANADFQADVARGGTLAGVIKLTVLADMTEARAAELEKSLQALVGPSDNNK
jgi:uncharacterized protein YecT (DUF1311 family)